MALYSNGADTRNTGADLVLGYAASYAGWGQVDWSAAANVNHARLTDVKAAPAVLSGQQVLDQSARSYLELAAPQYRLNLGALWRSGSWAVNLRESVFGPSAYLATLDNVRHYESRSAAKFITDLDVTAQLNKAWSLSAGANNLFNAYPDKLNGDYRKALNAAGRQNVAQYPSFSPIGINGADYYGKAAYRF
ncbi:TonB-dependent receptor [Oxalobacteraceae bacterium]|nr:TonB-dependent receptor [Oxalobacteraceae bacterium]